MVNFSLNAGSLMGIILAFAGAGLYFLRSFRPNLARDYDVFFAAIALLCGGILFFQSWRLDPILQFGVFLLAGSTVFFAVDSIRLRNIATEQAKRNTPLVDDDRPVSRSYQYQAELDNYGPGYDSFEERQPAARRIRGSRDGRSSGYDEYETLDARRPSRRPPRSLDRYDRPDRPDRLERLDSSDRLRRRPRDRDEWDGDSTPGPAYGDNYGAAGYGGAGYSEGASSNYGGNYGSPSPDPRGAYGGGSSYGSEPASYGPEGEAYGDRPDRSYGNDYGADYGGGNYGSGSGDYGDGDYGAGNYGPGDYGPGDYGTATDPQGDRSYSRSSRNPETSPEEPTDPNRRPRRRPPSSMLSRSPLGSEYGNPGDEEAPYTDYQPLG